MRMIWFYRLGTHGLIIGRGGCLSLFFLLVNLPVLLTFGTLVTLFWLRMRQFPTPLVLGAGAVIACETVVWITIMASRARGHFANHPSVFNQADAITAEIRTREQRRYQAIYDHFHALGEASRRHYEAEQRRRHHP